MVSFQTSMSGAPQYLEDYGPGIEPFLWPVKSLLDKGVKVVGQVHGYRAIGANWLNFITRNINGHMITPKEAVDRVTVMKMWTTWASEYVMREKDLGTLQTGKLADFVILDKDYFTIPVEQITQIRPQMTVMDGKIRYVGPEYAQKLGMKPVGYQYPPGYQPWAVSRGYSRTI